MIPSSSPAECGSIVTRMQNAAWTAGKKYNGVFKEPASFQQAQGTGDKKQNKSYKGMQSGEVPPAWPAGGLPKKTTEVGIRACDVRIRARLPIPCLFSSEKLPCEEKHSFYYLWGQPLLFIMLMLLCYMPSTSPLFHREVFLCTEGEKKKRKKTPTLFAGLVRKLKPG